MISWNSTADRLPTGTEEALLFASTLGAYHVGDFDPGTSSFSERTGGLNMPREMVLYWAEITKPGSVWVDL